MEEKDKHINDTIVEVTDNGPLKITGNIYLRDIKKGIGKTISEVYLCRCGRSGCKPYCDGTHKK